MLSHLRFHRRGPSNPTSPLPEQQTHGPWESTPFDEHPHTAQDVTPRPESRPQSANSSQLPPTLPPIPRVTSADSEPIFNLRDDDYLSDGQPNQYSSNNGRFIGGAALQNYRRGYQEASRSDKMAPPYATPEAQLSRATPPPPPINTGVASHRPAPVPTQQSKSVSSFATPTDLQQLSGGFTNKRPTGTRNASEPAVSVQQNATEPPKGRKGLPFLKNPMSTLLMRRKAAQNVPEPKPLPPIAQPEQPMYDPRIRGTKIHDFSTPRRKLVPQPMALDTGPTTTLGRGNELESSHRLAGVAELPEPFNGYEPGETATSAQLRDEPVSAVSPRITDPPDGPARQHQSNAHRLSGDKALPPEPSAHVFSEDDNNSSINTSSFVTASPAVSRQGSSAIPKQTPSSRTNSSRNVSVSGASRRDSTMSAVPRHMKSTSSRFSFDMIGAAKQEKLLEERHRQREMVKKTTEFGSGTRDSRFDDFDEDSFDYDAMMEDDGLEERIPGVNADLEEDDFEEPIPEVNDDYIEEGGFQDQGFQDGDLENEQYFTDEDSRQEEDPDNDQENFAGFVFQRSNPASTLVSPLTPNMLLVTPRDASGKVIGFAMTKDTTPELGAAPSPALPDDVRVDDKIDQTSQGLGIQGLAASSPEPVHMPPHEEGTTLQYANLDRPPPIREDDLYFDEGLADELNFEHDGTFFDESLFDLNDTDEYGRPIPGAFAEAKSRMAAKQQAIKRESEVPSSEQSAMSQSTAHTSLSAGLQPAFQVTEAKDDVIPLDYPSEHSQPPQRRSSILPSPSQDRAYQAALAEATHKAAASGKFRRSSSPQQPPAGLTVTSPSGPLEPNQDLGQDYQVNFDDDAFPHDGADDFDDDFDDEAIIAEANASALANDSDGWYGQEFGFYSAPVTLVPGGGVGGSHSAPSATSSRPLSAENLYQYANGGYFGPAGAGINRTTSGRIVREPNLTPITERSEYSNRNSIMSMSLAVPPGAGGAMSSSAPLHSPGLAQLAMMADEGGGMDDMTLGALMRLRNKAWGGSQASLISSRDGGGSPRSVTGQRERDDGGASSPWGAGAGAAGFPAAAASHARKGSVFSLWSAGSEPGGGGGSGATLTMMHAAAATAGQQTLSPASALGPSPVFATPGGAGQFASAASPVVAGQGGWFPPVLEEDGSEMGRPPAGQLRRPSSSLAVVSPSWSRGSVGFQDEGGRPVSPASPGSQFGGAGGKRPSGHRHKGSADSISYVKEEESGAWVMERRRTGESGEVEILEREVVEGGRI